MPDNPPPIIVDSNLSAEYADRLKEIVPAEIIYVNDKDNKYGANGDMSDEEIKKLQENLGAIVITQNGKHFKHKDTISLKSRKPVRYLINQTLSELRKHEAYSEYLKTLKSQYFG